MYLFYNLYINLKGIRGIIYKSVKYQWVIVTVNLPCLKFDSGLWRFVAVCGIIDDIINNGQKK